MYARDQDHEYANMLILKAFQGLNEMLFLLLVYFA